MSERRRPRANDEMDDWARVVDRLPFVSSIKRDMIALRRLLYDRRAPRIAAVGAERSGRTALANAMLGAHALGDDGAAPAPTPGQWMHIDADGRLLDWLELPAPADPDATTELGWRAFEDELPDLILGVVAAGEEATEGPRVRAALTALTRQLDEEHEVKPDVLVVLSKTDLLPPSDALPPYPSEKRTAIDLAVQALRKEMASLALPAEAFLPVCAARIDDDGSSRRWNLDALAEETLDRLPEPAQLEAARAFEVGREARRRVARAVVNSTSAVAVTVGLAPIPFADAFVLLPLQAAMVTGIAYLSGRPWDRKAAAEWVASVGVVGGAGMGLRWGAQQLVKLVPGAGSLVGAGVAGAGTLAIGRSAMAYFIDGPAGQVARKELRPDNA